MDTGVHVAIKKKLCMHSITRNGRRRNYKKK